MTQKKNNLLIKSFAFVIALALAITALLPAIGNKAATIALNESKKTLYYRPAGENVPDKTDAQNDKVQQL